jgi:ATP-grasp domain-containing protein
MLLSEWESKRVLGADLPRPRELLSSSVDEAVAFASGLGIRVVAKASGVGHKTEGGLVRLALDPDGVAACWHELAAAGDGHVLVAEQVSGELELIAGGLRDPQFGPLVSIGLGGIAAEILGDVAFVLSPPEPGELDRAIGRLRGRALFDGYRGRPRVDRAALGRVVGAIARLLDADPTVVEIDCNPILVVGGAPIVADALVVME